MAVGFLVAGFGMLVAIATLQSYIMLHHGQLFQENIFPVGLREHWLLWLGMVLMALVAVFVMLAGVATFRRKWPIRGWITGILAGLFLVCSIASAALAADAAPRIRERYESSLHTTALSNIQPFTRVVSTGNIDLAYVSSPTYAVNVHYFDHPDLSKLHVHVANGTLYVDSTQLDTVPHCHMLCLYPRYDMTVQVYAPNVQDFKTPPHTDIFYPAPPALN